MPSDQINDRRTFARCEAQFPIRIGAPEADAVATQTINISAGGAYCNVPHFIPPLTKMVVTMLIPVPLEGGILKHEVLQCHAIVVRVKPEVETENTSSYEIGLWFSTISAPDRRKVLQYVKQHLSNQ